MKELSTTDLKEARKNLKEAGFTLKGWAIARGHNPETARKLFYWANKQIIRSGEKSQEVIKDLEKEGFLKTKKQHEQAA